MGTLLRPRWRTLVQGLWFLPSLIVVTMGAAAFGLLKIDERLIGHGTPWVFGGDSAAARVVLTTIAGSLITVAGLTFSITIVVLQLASSQFTPRVLPNFLGDRITQITVGTFVGIFVFCLVGLRAVGGVQHFVPRLTVTTASALGIAAVILLIGFIHHVSTMIQVSNIAGQIARRTLRRIDTLHPAPFRERDDDPEPLLAAWRTEALPRPVLPNRPGYVEEIDLDAVVRAVGRQSPSRVHIPVAPGDFVSVETPIAEVWPAEAADGCEAAVARAVTISSERNFVQDVGFGVRQLVDVALRAISPSVNDPTTAVTCLGYVRSVLERLARRDLPAQIHARDELQVVAIVRRRSFDEYLAALLEVARYANGDQRVVGALLGACGGAAAAATGAGAHERAAAALATASRIAERAESEAADERERQEIRGLLTRATAAARP